MAAIYHFAKLAGGAHYIFQYIRNRKLSDVCHAHDFYEWIIVATGSCVHDVNGTVYTMQANDLVLLRPHEMHTLLAQSEDLCAIGLSVQKEEFEQMLRLYDPQMQLLGGSLQEAIYFNRPALHDTLRAMFGDVAAIRTQAEHRLLLAFLLQSCVAAVGQRYSAMPLWLADALKQMESPENLRVGIPALVHMTNYSQSRISHLMHRYMQTTRSGRSTRLNSSHAT